MFRVWWGICIWLSYKFPTESNSEKILKIGQYLVKLWTRCLVFFWLTVYIQLLSLALPYNGYFFLDKHGYISSTSRWIRSSTAAMRSWQNAISVEILSFNYCKAAWNMPFKKACNGAIYPYCWQWNPKLEVSSDKGRRSATEMLM